MFQKFKIYSLLITHELHNLLFDVRYLKANNEYTHITVSSEAIVNTMENFCLIILLSLDKKG